MKHRFIAAAALALTACAADPLAKYAGKPITCASFATQAEAQKFLEAHIEHAITLEHRSGVQGDGGMSAATLLTTVAAIAAAGVVAACSSDADVASTNLSKAADQFEVARRIVFYNGITGEYMLTIQGLCSLGNFDKAREISVTCKTGPGSYKKHFLGLSDNVTFFVEQVEPSAVSPYQYRVVFKPLSIVPDIEVRK
jgi:hypothetical protein